MSETGGRAAVGRSGGQAVASVHVDRPTARPLVLIAILALLSTAAATPALSQTPTLEDSRKKLEDVRRERQRLEEERSKFQGQVQNLGAEIDNLERQRQSTNRIVNALEEQINGLNSQVDRAGAELVLVQDNLAEKRAVLARRLTEIYKRGQLYTFEVLVAAQSFGDLLSRYKYLYIQSRQDRFLVGDVEKLTAQVFKRRGEIMQAKTQLDLSREEREAELRRYGRLVEERGQRLKDARRSSTRTEQQLTALEKDEARLSDLLVELERARRSAAARGNAAGAAQPATLSTADIGKLDWPVDGPILYNFGPQRLSSGATIRNNGIGIGAPLGTQVRAVEAGKVERVFTFSTYGLIVILDHGDGYRSLYMHLNSAAVKQGAQLVKGQVVGTTGGQGSDAGPQLYFEIRGPSGAALDPTDWLKARR
jgi:septal ring factor EnvC (AmiA/AmiB activator)